MDLVFEIAGDQIDGARDYQEDAFLTTYLDNQGDSRSAALVIMADGMGGHAAGNIASNLVVSTFNKGFTGDFGKSDAPQILRRSLDKANDALKESIKETPALDGMGCTMVTAAFAKGKVHWVSVGDSHLYVVRDRELTKKNEDHSYGGYLDRMQSQGISVEAEAGLSRNMLMSAMTGEEIAEIDCPSKGFQLLSGDRIIIASDGLDTLSEGVILQTSAWSPSAKECVQALLGAVEEAKKPRQDNTTVIVVDVTQREAPAEPVAPLPTLEPAERSIGDTQPLQMEDLQDELARERDLADAASMARGKTGTGMVLGAVAAVLVVAVGAGAWFLVGPGAGPSPTVAEAPPPTPVAEPAAATAPTEAPPPGAAEPTAITAPPPGAAEPTATTAPPTAEAQPVSAEPADQLASAPRSFPEPQAAVPTVEFRDDLIAGGQGPLMVRLPAGSFQMGSSGLSVEADERPRHQVAVGEFAISKYEITLAEYERFARATNRRRPQNVYLDKETHPAIFVTWDDAYAYTLWLSNEASASYRLPSEAEWEYAAAAGTASPYWWGFEVGENRAHCFDCRTGLNPRQATQVGRFEANPFGLHDTAGNVAEWVHDCYHPDYQGAPGNGRVWEGGDCEYRVTRGGSFTSTSKSIRSTRREKYRSQQGYDSIGFRVVRDL